MISVRTYQSSDYSALKALYEAPDTFGGQFDPDRESEERLRADANNVLVAEANGKVVGTVSLLQNSRFAWLMRFAVESEFETEATKALFEKATEILKASGHKQVLVYAPEGNAKFKKRYANLAFTEGNSYDVFWREL